MEKSERAKQFMPFAALRGYEDALRAKEKIVVEKIRLSEEMKDELDIALHHIRKNDMVTAVYFYLDEYLEVTGLVSRIDPDSRVLKIVNTKIPFDDLYRLELQEN